MEKLNILIVEDNKIVVMGIKKSTTNIFLRQSLALPKMD